MNKPEENDRVRLLHMLEAALHGGEFCATSSRESLDYDIKLQYALTHALTIVGEAANKVSDESKARHMHIPWEKVRGMRNRLVHGYDDINLSILWQAGSVELPALARQLRVIIDEMT